jgi:hypothetical protein
MWNEEVVTYFKVLTRHFPEETEETHEILGHTDDGQVGIRNGHLPNTCKKRYCPSHLYQT